MEILIKYYDFRGIFVMMYNTLDLLLMHVFLQNDWHLKNITTVPTIVSKKM